MDTLLFQQSQSIDEIKNRLNCIETGSLNTDGGGSGVGGGSGAGVSLDDIENIKPALISDTEFVNGIVDNIMNNSNLSEIIEQIDTVQNENRELRELFYAQQKTINEMNIMLLKLFSQVQSQGQVAQPVQVAASPIQIPVSSTSTPAPIVDQDQEEQDQEISDPDQNMELEIVE